MTNKKIKNLIDGIPEVTKKVILEGKIYVRDIKGNYIINNVDHPRKITSPEDALLWLSVLKNQEQEIMAVLLLDGENKIISIHEITKGLVNESQIHPREVFKEAIRHNAVSIFIAHNHPSGSLTISIADRVATKRMVEAGKILSIPVLDHLIIGNGYISIREKHPEYFI